MVEKKDRLISLDVFRGMTVAGMILVNTPGNWSYIYPPLRHAEWHGFTPTDLVFPFFLFAVGVSMSFSLKTTHTKTSASLKIVKRTVLIFLIGLLLNAFPFFNKDYDSLRIMGVLQRIALAYGISAFICLFFQNRLIIISTVILLSYWAILWLFGGPDPFSLEGYVGLQLDLSIFGPDHLWKGMGKPFDPEGILSTFPASVNAVIGFMVGRKIQNSKNKSELISKTMVLGNLLIFAALVWNIFLPINKPIWTSSYVLMSSGIAMVIIGILIYLIDHQGYKSWVSPFLVFGRNPLIIFILSIVWVKIYFLIKTDDGNAYGWVYQNIFVPIGGNMNGSLLFALAHVIVLWFIGWVLYRKNIIVKI